MKPKVGYIYSKEMADNSYFPADHPMKPRRFKMAHSLINSYGMYLRMDVYKSKVASADEMTMFHSKEYIRYLMNYVSPDADEIIRTYDGERKTRRTHDQRFGETADCPVYSGLYNFCQQAIGASLDCADLVITGEADIAINWAGGFHHAKKGEMSGFCYVNDVVICILELLKFFPRVMYLDVDVHHGDGVEEAFYATNRVVTVSFHEYGDDFFPGSGSLASRGRGAGYNYAINVPMKRGMTDESYFELFRKVVDEVVAHYRPDVVVMQCGADTLSRDRLGHFNLSVKGHSRLV